MRSVADYQPKTLDLEITSKCNISCRYCYLGKPGTGSMDMVTAAQVVAYAEKLATHHCHPIIVNLHGGEPFLNFDTVQFLVSYAPARFTIFTNGATATTEQVRWCQRHKVAAKRSTAACREAADLTRPDGYTDQWLTEGALWGDYGATHRLTVIPATAPYIVRSVQWLRQEGYYGPVDIATDDYCLWTPDEQDIFASQLHWLADLYILHFRRGDVLGVENFANFGRAIFGQSAVMVLGCGAGWETVGITTSGRIVYCHRAFRTPMEPTLTVADLLDGKPLDFGPAFTARFTDISTGREEPDCQRCEARQCCPHGCLHVSHVTGGNFTHQPEHRCRFVRLYRDIALRINDALSITDPKWWERQPTKP